jgi:hypothetical protein
MADGVISTPIAHEMKEALGIGAKIFNHESEQGEQGVDGILKKAPQANARGRRSIKRIIG